MRRYITLLAFFCACIFAGSPVFAQTKSNPHPNHDSAAAARQQAIEAQKAMRQKSMDSAAAARQQAMEAQKAIRQKSMDSARTARQHTADSLKTARAHVTDSLQTARKIQTDKLAAIKKYKDSKHYKDSVATAKKTKADAIRLAQKNHSDSLRAQRQHVTDSATAARKLVMDVIHAKQKRRADSLAVITKYKNSKRFRDSVDIVKQGRADSLRVVRKRITDSTTAVRKAAAEVLTKARKHTADSLTAARKKRMDIINSAKKAKTDSLAKVKAKKDADQKLAQKAKENKTQLQLQLKIKAKQSKYNNESLLKKSWGMPRRIVQNTFTRYNYYFNADKKMDEALLNMQRLRKDNYDTLIPLYPFDPDRDSTALAPDMDSIVMKASLGIQIHDPRVKWGDDLYLLLGQAYFYKGRYKDAAASFRYILSLKALAEKGKKKKNNAAAKKTDKTPSIAEAEKKSALDFLKHQTVHNEGLLWLTRTYAQMNELDKAESVIDLLAADPNFPEHLQSRLALEKAFVYIKEKNTRGTIAQLTIVADDNDMPQWIRLRSAYLTGQLQQKLGDYTAAVQSFGKVVDIGPKIDMDFYARKQLAYSQMYAGGDQQDAIASLKHMLNDGKYAPYYEQIYYVLGRLSANSNNPTDAIAYLKKSIAAPKSTKKQKAISFAAIGNVYYQTGNYPLAKRSYDSAAYLATHAGGDSLVAIAVKRAKSLDEVAGPYNTIKTQDSLLTLSYLVVKDQQVVVRKYIKYLEKQKADSAFQAENPTGAGQVEGAGDNSNVYSNWYYTNSGQMQQGFNDFKRKWGNRPNVDNWRRTGALSFASGNNTPPTPDGGKDKDSQGDEGTEGNTAELDENGLPTEASLMALIPATAEKKDQTKLRVERGYVDLANAYMRLLEDYVHAQQTLDTLDTKYPGHPHGAEVLYMRYVIALRQNKLADAQRYSGELQQKYADSRFAALVKPTEDAPIPDGAVTVSAYYAETYEMLMNRQYTEAANRAKLAKTKYNSKNYNSKFTVLEASALAGAANYDLADSLITDFIKTNSGDSLISWAESVKQYIAQNKPKPAPAPLQGATGSLGKDSLMKSGAVADPLTAGGSPTLDKPSAPGATTVTPVPVSSAPAPAEVPASYTYAPGDQHYFLFVFPKMESKVMGVKAGMGDFNTAQFASLGLTSNIELLKNQKGVIVIQHFANAAQARIYMNAIRTASQLYREYTPQEYQLLIISAKNYQKLMIDKDIDAYQQFYTEKYH